VLRPGRESHNYSRMNFMNGRAILVPWESQRNLWRHIQKTNAINYTLLAVFCGQKLHTSTHKGVVVPMQVLDIIKREKQINLMEADWPGVL